MKPEILSNEEILEELRKSPDMGWLEKLHDFPRYNREVQRDADVKKFIELLNYVGFSVKHGTLIIDKKEMPLRAYEVLKALQEK